MTSLVVLSLAVLLAVLLVLLSVSRSFADATTEELFQSVQNPKIMPRQVWQVIRLGADVNAHMGENNAPILCWAAACTRYPDVIKALIEAGANVNDVNGISGFPSETNNFVHSEAAPVKSTGL